MRIVKHRQRVSVTYYRHHWDWEGETDWGFAFDCAADGSIDEDSLHDCAKGSLAWCRQGHDDEGHRLIDRGVVTYRHTYHEPADGLCACGRRVTLDHALVNSCACGREYNMSGQLLAPRSQWGWDTGETISEIMEGNVGINDPIDHLFESED